MNPRTTEYLRLLHTTLGWFPFKQELDGGRLLGYPVIDSTTMSLNWNSVAGDGLLVLVDGAQLVFAEDLAVQVDASEEATIQSDDAPATPPAAPYVSAFQQDMVFMRLRMSHTWARRYDEAIAYGITKV